MGVVLLVVPVLLALEMLLDGVDVVVPASNCDDAAATAEGRCCCAGGLDWGGGSFTAPPSMMNKRQAALVNGEEQGNAVLEDQTGRRGAWPA